jgi:hypothetical protein
MLGFLIGTVCLIGLIKTLRGGCGGGRWGRGGWGYGGGYGGCGGGGCGEHRGYGGHHGHHGHHEGWGGPPWARGGFGRGMMLRALFQRLETTPGQEKVIAQALEELRAEAEKHRGELKQSRADVAKAVRSEGFDEVLFGELFSRQDTTIEALRKAAMGSIGKVHAILEPKQRELFAEIIEGGLFRGFGGPFRGAGGWG